MSKTKQDCLLAFCALLGERTNPAIKEAFEQHFLPALSAVSPGLGDAMSDDEFNDRVQAFKQDLPAIVAALQSHPLPPGMAEDTRN